jgi:DNA-binding response OmpR family regulator
MRKSEENVALLGQIKGAIIVVRSLVQAENRLNPVVLARTEELARHCGILAGQVKLPMADTHRLVLAAWVSGFRDEDGPAGDFIKRYGLSRLLHREGDTWAGRRIDEQVFGVVRLYVALKSRNPAIAEDMGLARRSMEKHWDDQESMHLIRRLLQTVKGDASFKAGGGMSGIVLVLDPSEVVTPILVPPLRAEGFEVAVSDDAGVARRLVKHVRPDVIIAERQRHMVDGLEFCKEIKSDPETAHILYFILSDKGGKTVEREGVLAGSDGVFIRPVDFQMLLLKISKGLSARPARAEAGYRDGFTGNLAEISFTDMIQIVCAGGKTVAIELTRGHEHGTVHVKEGEVMSAKVGALAGPSAFHALMKWREGTFRSRQTADTPERTIHESLIGMLMEGARLADEDESDRKRDLISGSRAEGTARREDF